MDLSREVETLLTVAHYFHVPPLDLIGYPNDLYNAMVLYLDQEIRRKKQEELHNKMMANLGGKGGSVRHHNRNLRRR